MTAEANEAMQDLASLGYAFDEDGILKKLAEDGVTTTDEGFQFEVRPGDHAFNQKNYEELGEAVTEFVYDLLISRCKLEKVYLQGKEKEDQQIEDDEQQPPRSFIFVSPGYEKKEKLLVLIHGSGVVRAGQWARKLIINNGRPANALIRNVLNTLGLFSSNMLLNLAH